MADLTVAELRQHVESDLGDPALQRLLSDAYSVVRERAGSTDPVTSRYVGNGDSVIWLGGRVAAVPLTSVTENGTVLVEGTSYRVLYEGRGIERIDPVTLRARAWGADVTVVYNRADDDARRKRVVIDLCKLALQFDGTQSNSVGDWSQTNPEYQRAREQVLRGLVASPFTFA